MSKHDPWTRPGAIYIPSDFAPVPPVPAGTRLGNVQEMAEEMEPFHRALVELTKDPVKLREAVSALTDQWKPDEFDAEILRDLHKTRTLTPAKRAGRRGRARHRRSARLARRHRSSVGTTSRFHSLIASWLDGLRRHLGLGRKTVANPS